MMILKHKIKKVLNIQYLSLYTNARLIDNNFPSKQEFFKNVLLYFKDGTFITHKNKI